MGNGHSHITAGRNMNSVYTECKSKKSTQMLYTKTVNLEGNLAVFINTNTITQDLF